jgi:hypothetical protein
MSEAMKTIVGTYVRLSDVEALQNLRDHRAKLLLSLRSSGAVDFNAVTDVLENEIGIIDEGLATLDPKPPEHGVER